MARVVLCNIRDVRGGRCLTVVTKKWLFLWRKPQKRFLFDVLEDIVFFCVVLWVKLDV